MKNYLTIAVLLLLVFGCNNKGERSSESSDKSEVSISKDLDIQGHRGARGLLPENTIRGFRRAVQLEVNTLEMDVCVTKDNKVIVSHEPYISSEYCLHPKDGIIDPKVEKDYNIYEMTYSEVREFNCGSLMHPRFPKQGKVQSYKPLLSSVIKRVEAQVKKEGKEPVRYNIELKSTAETDNTYHPAPAEFSDLVYQTIDGKLDWSLVTIQSFDFRILQYFREKYPDVKLSLLIENEHDWKQNVDSLGFTPDVYSCWFKLLDKEIVSDMQSDGMAVIPWTVNDSSDIISVAALGVDGIISDYPDLAISLLR